MELMEEVKGYSDSREEEEEEEAAEIMTITREESNSKHHYPFSSPYSTTNYTKYSSPVTTKTHGWGFIIMMSLQMAPILLLNLTIHHHVG